MESRKRIVIISLIILAVYNVIAFLIPSVKNITFWSAYIFSSLSIIISSLVILSALDEEGIKNKFKNMPTVYVAITYLIIQLIMGFVEIYSPINYRMSILINIVILGISIITLSGVNAGKKEIQRVEEKVKEKVFFIKDLQADIEIFENKIENLETKKEINMLVETIRFSDPMTHSKLATIENQINIKAQTLMQEKDNNEIKKLCSEMQQLFAERNKKAKLYKSEPEPKLEEKNPINFKAIISVIITVIVLICIAVTVYFTVIIPNKEYNEAEKLLNNKEYTQAEKAFRALGDYKDSKEKLKEISYIYGTELLDKKDYSKAEKEFDKILDYKDSKDKRLEAIYKNAEELLKNKEYSKAVEEYSKLDDYKDAKEKLVQIYNLFGEKDVIYFGKYKGTPIGWKILDRIGNQVLLITTEPMDEMAYNTEYKKVDWESSTIRKWLNEDFYNTFDEKDRQRIIKDNGEKDNVFLLIRPDIKKYKNLNTTSMSWWIKENGDEETKAMYVTENGTLNETGDIVTKLHGVRPCIWLNLN